MSQLSFFDVDLSQYPKIEPSALTGAPSKGHLKGEKTGDRKSVV